MRTALLAASRFSPDGTLRAGLMLGGRSVLEWQAQLAQDIGCGRIVVLASAPDDNIVAVQQLAERSGMQFHCLKGFSRLPALLHGDDDVLIIADGMMPDHAQVKEALCPPASDPEVPAEPLPSRLRKAILCIDASHPLTFSHPADFERIDASRSWAGVLVMRGAFAQQLDEFAQDSDAFSVLLRLALQSHTPCIMLALDMFVQGEWLLAHDAGVLREHEAALIRKHAAPQQWGAPGTMLANRLAVLVEARSLGTATAFGSATAIAAMLAAVLLAVFGYATAAMGLALLGSFAFCLARAFMQMRARLQQRHIPDSFAWLHDPGADALAMIVLLIALAPPWGLAPIAAIAPLSFGLLRIAAAVSQPGRDGFWQDRPTHLALMTLAAVFNFLPEGAAIVGIAALVFALIQTQAFRPQGDHQS